MDGNGCALGAVTRVLITGFGPFPGVPVNASMGLLHELAHAAPRLFPSARFSTAVLATEWREAPLRLDRLVAAVNPDLALHFGVSARARGFEIEARAHNACCPTADAAGALPAFAKLDAAGAEHLAATLPVNLIAARLRRIGIPAFVSRDAGSYLCNATLYHSLRLARSSSRRRVGFIHIPASLAGAGSCRPGGSCPLTWDAAISGAIELLAVCLGRPGRRHVAAFRPAHHATRCRILGIRRAARHRPSTSPGAHTTEGTADLPTEIATRQGRVRRGP
jgi:pyroglutamyl-peptidase